MYKKTNVYWVYLLMLSSTPPGSPILYILTTLSVPVDAWLSAQLMQKSSHMRGKGEYGGHDEGEKPNSFLK